MKKKRGYFSISAVSHMFNIHQQTIRMYEKLGFISPKRSEGNTRMFTENDINALEKIIYYTNKLGVNLSGVDIILKMQKKIDKMQQKINEILSQSKHELSQEIEILEQEILQSEKNMELLRNKTTTDEKADTIICIDNKGEKKCIATKKKNTA